jgi:hypothetical protein
MGVRSDSLSRRRFFGFNLDHFHFKIDLFTNMLASEKTSCAVCVAQQQQQLSENRMFRNPGSQPNTSKYISQVAA